MRRALIAAIGAAALGGCGDRGDPDVRASCAPDPQQEEITCTVVNRGTRAGRACLTVRVQPRQSAPIIARRICTGMLEPAQTQVLTPKFDQLPRARMNKTLASRCVDMGSWVCDVSIVETPREMAENLPGDDR